MVWHDSAMAGDVYKLEARTITQRTSPTKTFTFHRANNGLLVFPVGATYVPPPPTQSVTISSFVPGGVSSIETFVTQGLGLVLPANWFAGTVTQANRTIGGTDGEIVRDRASSAGNLNLSFANQVTASSRRLATGKDIRATVTVRDGTSYTFSNVHSRTLDPRTTGILLGLNWNNSVAAGALLDNRATILPMTLALSLIDL